MIRFHIHALPGICLALFLPAVSSAQLFGGGPPLSGSGTATIERPAERLRAVIPLTDQGEDVRSAVEALNEKIDVVKVELTSMGAEQDSIRTTPVSIDEGTSDAHRQMLMRMRAAMAGGGFGDVDEEDEEESGDTMISVRTRLTVEWPLPAGNPVELLEAAWKIKNAIDGAEFNGAEEEDSEEQEMLEEAMMFGESDDETSDQVQVVFLAKVSEEEHAELMKKAFAKARAEAETLAAAAGVKLGRLTGVQTDDDDYGYAAMARSWMSDSDGDLSSHLSPEEAGSTAVGKSAAQLQFSVTVNAGFEFAE